MLWEEWGKTTLVVKTVPVYFLQFKQWQHETVIGDAMMVNLILPQRQLHFHVSMKDSWMLRFALFWIGGVVPGCDDGV
jgi:hypothetical protein